MNYLLWYFAIGAVIGTAWAFLVRLIRTEVPELDKFLDFPGGFSALLIVGTIAWPLIVCAVVYDSAKTLLSTRIRWRRK